MPSKRKTERTPLTSPSPLKSRDSRKKCKKSLARHAPHDLQKWNKYVVQYHYPDTLQRLVASHLQNVNTSSTLIDNLWGLLETKKLAAEQVEAWFAPQAYVSKRLNARLPVEEKGKEEKEKEEEKAVNDFTIFGQSIAGCGKYVCPVKTCGSSKIDNVDLQSRGGDEGMSYTFLCGACGTKFSRPLCID